MFMTTPKRLRESLLAYEEDEQILIQIVSKRDVIHEVSYSFERDVSEMDGSIIMESMEDTPVLDMELTAAIQYFLTKQEP